MATSGSKDFELDVAEYVEEAFERCGLEVRTGYDLRSAKRSLNLLFADWANRGLNQWTIEEVSITLATGIRDYPGGTLTMTVGSSARPWLLQYPRERFLAEKQLLAAPAVRQAL